jgi:hypothetical protein
LENAKNKLALQPDFNLLDAFDLLERHGFSSLSATELSDSLAVNGVYTISDDVFLFVKRYERTEDFPSLSSPTLSCPSQLPFQPLFSSEELTIASIELPALILLKLHSRSLLQDIESAI